MMASTSVIHDWQLFTGCLTLKSFGWLDYHSLYDVRESLAAAGIKHQQVRAIIGPVRIHRGSGVWPMLSSISGNVEASGSPVSGAFPHLHQIDGNLKVADGVILPSIRFVRGDVHCGDSCSLPDLRHIQGDVSTSAFSNLPSLMTICGGVHAPYTPLPNLLFIGKGGTLSGTRDVPLLEAAGEGLWFWRTKSSSKAGITIGNHQRVISLINALRDLDLARLAHLDLVHRCAQEFEVDKTADQSEFSGLGL